MKIANYHYPISMWLRNAGKPLPNIDQPVCPTTSTANPFGPCVGRSRGSPKSDLWTRG